MAWERRFAAGHGVVHAVFSDRRDGDFSAHLPSSELHGRQEALAPVPWTSLDQVHGARVVEVTEPGGASGTSADAAVTSVENATLSVRVADCAPVLMFAPLGGGVVVAAAHAGWRGVLRGVLGATVEVMRARGAPTPRWLLGPCIGVGAYEFSGVELERMVKRHGPTVAGRTSSGRPALDLREAVHMAMLEAGCGDPLETSPACTATSELHWSHRAAADPQRQVGAIWWQRAPAATP